MTTYEGAHDVKPHCAADEMSIYTEQAAVQSTVNERRTASLALRRMSVFEATGRAAITQRFIWSGAATEQTLCPRHTRSKIGAENRNDFRRVFSLVTIANFTTAQGRRKQTCLKS